MKRIITMILAITVAVSGITVQTNTAKAVPYEGDYGDVSVWPESTDYFYYDGYYVPYKTYKL